MDKKAPTCHVGKGKLVSLTLSATTYFWGVTGGDVWSSDESSNMFGRNLMPELNLRTLTPQQI